MPKEKRDEMNKALRILIVAAVIAALVLVGLPLLSQLIYGRSLQATLFAWQLRKDAYLNDYYFMEYLLAKEQENARHYDIPEDAELTVPVVEQEYAGMPMYALNGAKGLDRIVFYFTGGSYIDQPRTVQWVFLNALAEDLDCTIVVPIYPKLPDTNAESCIAALTDAYTEYMRGMVHGEIIFMGDSAGGGLALSLAMHLRDEGLEGPDKLILICPWVDVSLTNSDMYDYEKRDPALDSEQLRQLGDLWADELGPKDPVPSPLYGDLSRLGRITILTGSAELLYPDILLLDEKLTEQGIDHDLLSMKGMFHVWPLYIGYGIPETEEAYDFIVRAALSE